MTNDKPNTMLVGAAAVLAVLLLAEPAFAAGGGEEGFPWLNWGFSILNLIIFLWLIVKFGGSQIQGFFKNRREELIDDLEEARRLREEAEARLEEYSTKLDALEDERKKLLDEYHEQGEREKKRIIEEAKEQVERMHRDAQVTIAQETKKAIAELETQAVDLAVEMAEDLAKKRLDSGQRDKLVANYVGELEGLERDGESERAA
ncbi:MAG: F0F1 ATP synthase subunit B [Myxococcota bacterium]